MHIATAAPPFRADDRDELARWRRSITWGNRAFDERDYATAIAHYDAAVSVADAMYGRVGDAEAGTAAWVVAHHNLADAYARLGRDCDQCRHLCAAHTRLCDTMNGAALPIRWQTAAQRHCRRTYAELTHYAAGHPDDAAAREACQLGAAGPTHAMTRQ